MIKLIFSPGGLILIGAIIAAVGGYLSYVQSQKFEGEIQGKNVKIEELNKYILSSITGGNSYCKLTFMFLDNNDALMMVIPSGEFPLFDVSLRIVDLEKFEEDTKKNLSLESLSKSQIIRNIGNVSPKTTVTMGKINLGSGDKKDYNVFISARNGHLQQLIRLRRVDGKWLQANSMKRMEEKNGELASVTISEDIPDGFPRNEKGKVDW